jgi:hypothetical protein
LTGTDRTGEPLRDSFRGRLGRAQAQQYQAEDDIAGGVDREHCPRANPCDDEAGECGSDRPGAVDGHTAEGRRLTDLFPRHDLGDECLGRGQRQRDAAAKKEGERQQQRGGHPAGNRQGGQRGSRACLEHLHTDK